MKEIKSLNQHILDIYSKYIGKIIYEEYEDKTNCFVKIVNVEIPTKVYTWESVRVKYQVWLSNNEWSRINRGKIDELLIFKNDGWSGKKKNYIINKKEMNRLLMLNKLESKDDN